jgi:hypothetical protein
MKTDGLRPIGALKETFGQDRDVVRRWRVVEHRFMQAVNRVCEMVMLEAELPMEGYFTP